MISRLVPPSLCRLAKRCADLVTDAAYPAKAEFEALMRGAFAAAGLSGRSGDDRFQALFAEAGVGIVVLDPSGIILTANSRAGAMLGLGGEFAGRALVEVVQTEAADRARWKQLIAGAVDGLRAEVSCGHRDGGTRELEFTLSVIRDGDSEPELVVGVVVDNTERRSLARRLWHQARHDSLTGLPNRTMFLDRLDDVRQPSGLCYIDLDGFKNINDSLGHDTGDELLVAVADRLRAVVGPEAVLARIGGDEFGILVEGCPSAADLAEQARRIMLALDRPIEIDGAELTVTASLAAVHTSVAGRRPRDLMRAADIALYRAKALGTGRLVSFDPAHGAEDTARHVLATELPLAVTREQFVLDYQPLVDLADGSAAGFEALVRWQHPKLGRLAPDRFIPLAEETGHIIGLGQWVLRASCRQARAWYDEFGDGAGYVSVNVAATQLREPTFVADVLGALTDTGLPADRLQLELTESAVAGDTPGAMSALRALADAGVALAIDDFGTGYSNLAHLGKLPVHKLKIDRSFLASPAEPAHDKIVAATITLAHSLGLSVAAEGVETAAQVDQLRLLECDSAQGYYFGRPAPPDSASAMMAAGAR